MKRFKIKYHYMGAVLLILAIATPVRSDSYYSCRGLGLTQYGSSAHATGMGGIGLAIIDDLSLNEMNPAAVESYGLTRITGDFAWVHTIHQVQTEQGLSRFANPVAFRMLIPLKKSFSIMFAFSQVARSRYAISETNKINDAMYNRELSQNGGINRGIISFHLQPIKFFRFGANINFNFGKFDETWKIDFYDQNFKDGENSYSTNLYGTNFTLGTILAPLDNLNLAFTFENKVTLGYETTITYYAFDADNKKQVVNSAVEDELPGSRPILAPLYGFGFSYLINGKLLIGMDYLQRNWSEFNSKSDATGSLTNSRRLGLGLQYRKSQDVYASFLQRALFRVGAYYGVIAFQEADGDYVPELFGSLGLGIPFHGNRGRIDCAVEFGKRGNLSTNDLEEKIIQFSVSILGAERWFVRRK